MIAAVDDGRLRCGWAAGAGALDVAYHDTEWGVPLHDDVRLFEMLTLEGAQAGLSWSTILAKREGYRKAFAGFDPKRVVRFAPARIDKLLLDPGIVRNRLKVESTVSNAGAVLEVQTAFGSLDAYLWGFVDGQPIINTWRDRSEVPTSTPISDAMSKDLKKRGFRFVGTTIMYAFMQATGMVDDHAALCFRRRERAGGDGRPSM